MQKIGLIVGREWSFPPAFIEEVDRRDDGVMAEFVKLGGTRMDEPCAYAVHHRPHLARGAVLPHATSSTRCSQGATVVNNPFMWTADDKFFGASLAAKLGVASPKTVVLPNKEYVPGIVHDREPAQPRVPARLGGRSSSTSGCRASSRTRTAAAGRTSTSATRSRS